MAAQSPMGIASVYPLRITGIWLWCGVALLLPGPGTAAEDSPQPLLAGERHRWAACIDGPRQLRLAPDTGLPDAVSPATDIFADFMNHDARAGTWDLRGNVELERGGQRLRADEMHYDLPADRVTARGNLRFTDDALLLGSEQGYLELERERGEMQGVEYLIPEALTQGTAGHVRLEDGNLVHLADATYSTCEPGDELWYLRVSRLRLDRESGVGEAWHARMHLLGVPVAYVPYVNFPLDDRRKTGLLPPTMGRSTRSGTDLQVPFYWNIAPNYDLTLTPRYLSRRGFMLQNSFRYLRPRQSGELRTAWLPDDDLFGDDRWSVAWDHRATLSQRLRGDLTLNRVSDQDYFRDFGNNLSQSSRTHLPTQARLNYNSDNIAGGLRAQTFQTVSPDIGPGNRPYQRLPQATFSYTPEGVGLGAAWLRPRLDAEAVRFDHPRPDLRSTGTRLDLAPRVSLPVRGRAGYVNPSVAMRLTSYDLDRPESAPLAENRITRSLPVASLDTGLFFDRFFTAFDLPLWQTLEPRLFYLYVPERDQDNIPRFDTARAEPSLYRLFAENRFVGPDRIGDANQVTLGLTSRFLNQGSGREYFRVGVGRTYYLEDRQVTLNPGAPPETHPRSHVIGEAQASLPSGFQASAELQWDTETDRSRLGGARLSWQPSSDRVLSAGYRLRRDNRGGELEQGDIAAVWPLQQHWHLIGGWRYSLQEKRTLESFGGLEYRDCCWSIRLVNRYYREDPAEDPERSIMLQFEFRGLGSIGDDIGSFLEDTVFGFEDMR